MDANTLLGMLNGAHAASPSPPQTASPAATLQSLMLQLQSPASSNKDMQEPTRTVTSPIGRATDIAEMLRGASLTSTIPPPSAQQANGSPQSYRISSPGVSNAQSLLATLMSGSNPASATASPAVPPFSLQNPVIRHASQQEAITKDISASPSSPGAGKPSSATQSLGIFSQEKPNDVEPKADEGASLEKAAKPLHSQENGDLPSESPSVNPSKFNFISPFDAFDLPRPSKSKTKQKEDASKRVVSTSAKRSNKVQSGGSQGVISPNPVVPLELPASPSKVSKSVPSETEVKPEPVATAEPEVKTELPKKKAEALSIPYAISPSKGELSKLPSFSSAVHIFDVSEPNLDSVIGSDIEWAKGAVAAVKTTVLSTGIVPGRKIATSPSYVSYALTKGKLRIINYNTGANTAITLTNGTPVPPKILEAAICENYVAALGDDGTFAFFTIKTDSHGEELEASLYWSVSASSLQIVSIGFVQDQQGDGYHLVIITKTAVYLLAPEKLRTLSSETTPDILAKASDNHYDYTGKNATYADADVDSSTSELTLLLKGDVSILVHIKGDSVQQADIAAPAHGGQWQSIHRAGDVVILGSTLGEYTLFDVQSQGTSDSSTFYLQGSIQGEQDGRQSTSAVFDKARNVLWIACWVRASVFAVRVNASAKKFVSFVEIPVGPISDLAVDVSDGSTLSAVFYRHPAGISTAELSQQVNHALDAAETITLKILAGPAKSSTKKKLQPEPVVRAQEKSVPSAQNDSNAPAQTKAENIPRAKTPKPVVAAPAKQQPALPDGAAIDLTRISKSIAEAVSSELRSALQKQDSQIQAINTSLSGQLLSQTDVVQSITREVEHHVKTTLADVVAEETRQSILPGLHVILQEQIESLVGDQLASSIVHSVETTVMAQVERALVPHLGRTFTAMLSPVVERSVRSLIDENLLPKFVQAVEFVPSELGRIIRQEMLDIRKDVMIEQSVQTQATEAIMETLIRSLTVLTDQVQGLTREIESLKATPQIAQQPPVAHTMAPPSMSASAPGPVSHPGQHVATGQQAIVSPQPVLPPNAGALQQLIAVSEDAEEEFLQAFSSFPDEELVRFVINKLPRTIEYLPGPAGGTSPLSQAVLLTMIHRLSKCLDTRPTDSREYEAILSWIFRSAHLINSRDQTIQAYLPAVKKTLEQTFKVAMDRYAAIGDRTQATLSAVHMMLDTIAALNRP